MGSELVEEDVDMNDPNYESDSLENGDIELKPIIPEASDEELRVSIFCIFDYFDVCSNCRSYITCHFLNNNRPIMRLPYNKSWQLFDPLKELQFTKKFRLGLLSAWVVFISMTDTYYNTR